MKKFMLVTLFAALAAMGLSAQTAYSANPAPQASPAASGGDTSNEAVVGGIVPEFWQQNSVTYTGKFFPKPGDPALSSVDEVKAGSNSTGVVSYQNLSKATWGEAFFVKSMGKVDIPSTGSIFLMGQLGLGLTQTLGTVKFEEGVNVSAPLAHWDSFQPGVDLYIGDSDKWSFSAWTNVAVSPFGVKQNIVSPLGVWSKGTDDRSAWAIGAKASYTWLGFLKTGIEGDYSYSNDLFGKDKNLLNPGYNVGGSIGVVLNGKYFGFFAKNSVGGSFLPYTDKTSGDVKASQANQYGLEFVW